MLQSESVEDMEKEMQRGDSEDQEEMHSKGTLWSAFRGELFVGFK